MMNTTHITNQKLKSTPEAQKGGKPKHMRGKENVENTTEEKIPEKEKCKCAVFLGVGKGMEMQTLRKPKILKPTDALIKVLKTTICGTDLHILRGSVFTCHAGRRIGHEGIGEILELGSAVHKYKVGDRIVVSCITNCGECLHCKKQFYGHCKDGGWILGNEIDGMQGQFARIPHVERSCYKVPKHVWDTDIEDGLVMCSDILPTGLECGLLDGGIEKGQDTIAIVGAGPVGLAALIATSVYHPKRVFVVDLNPHRLHLAEDLGSTAGFENTKITGINASDGTGVEQILKLTDGVGVDLVIEAVGLPASWSTCQDVVKAGGHIAVLGVHGLPATINLERMWFRNFKMTAGMVHGYTTQSLMDRVLSGEIDACSLISHRMPLSEVEKAYEMFGNAAEHGAIKILLVNDM